MSKVEKPKRPKRPTFHNESEHLRYIGDSIFYLAEMLLYLKEKK